MNSLPFAFGGGGANTNPINLYNRPNSATKAVLLTGTNNNNNSNLLKETLSPDVTTFYAISSFSL